MTIDIETLKSLQQQGKIRGFSGVPQPRADDLHIGSGKKSKFHNVITVVDGEKIHSKGEAKRYRELRAELKAGLLLFLARQVDFELNPGGTHSVIYRADFVYMFMPIKQPPKFLSHPSGLVVEDFKGARTAEYLKKKKLMKKIHGITILET